MDESAETEIREAEKARKKRQGESGGKNQIIETEATLEDGDYDDFVS